MEYINKGLAAARQVMERHHRGARHETNGDGGGSGAPVRTVGQSPEVGPFRAFPLGALPDPLARYVEAAAKAIDCDPVMVALPALVVAAGAIGNARQVSVKRSWAEPAVLWAAVIGDSSTK